MESRIRKIQQMLRDPEIVEAPVEADAVAPGMLVTVRPLDERPRTRRTCWRSMPRSRLRPPARSPRPRRSAPRSSGRRPVTRSRSRRPAEASATRSSRSSRTPVEVERDRIVSGRRTPTVRRVRTAVRQGPDGSSRDVPRARDMPPPRRNESAAGGAMQRVFSWPYRGILAFLVWTGIRPWQLTLLSLAFTIVAGAPIVTGAWFVGGARRDRREPRRCLRRLGRTAPRRGEALGRVHGLRPRPCLRHDLVHVPVLGARGRRATGSRRPRPRDADRESRR